MSINFSIPKTPKGLVNFSVVREDGHRLSLAADDSCGAMGHHGRICLMELDAKSKDVGKERMGVTPVEYLDALAKFLGYELVVAPRDAVKSFSDQVASYYSTQRPNWNPEPDKGE